MGLDDILDFMYSPIHLLPLLPYRNLDFLIVMNTIYTIALQQIIHQKSNYLYL